MSHRREIRARASLEKRALTDAEKEAGYIGAITGKIPYNSDSELLHKRGRSKPFVERIAPGAFDQSLKEDRDIMANAGHTDDPLAAIGRIGENLTVTTDKDALNWEALVPDTRAGKDLLSLVDKGIIRGTSFEFEVRGSKGERYESRDAQTDTRTIVDARLIAFNPVTWPAYSDSSLTVEMRRAPGRESADFRGHYHSCDGVVDWYDPTITPDTKFAGAALNRATYALTDALEYLRAAPAGALADYARTEVSTAAANAQAMIDWLATNGATVNPAAEGRAKEAIAEARSATAEEPTTDFDTTDRDRRLRVLKLTQAPN